jgi:hypothetical protein
MKMGGESKQLEVLEGEGEPSGRGCGSLQVSGLGHSFLLAADWPAGFCWSADLPHLAFFCFFPPNLITFPHVSVSFILDL